MTIQKMLIYKSWHRGMREADLILGPFAGMYVNEFSPLHLKLYEEILEIPDAQLLAWIYKKEPVPEEMDNEVMQKIISFAHKGKNETIVLP